MQIIVYTLYIRHTTAAAVYICTAALTSYRIQNGIMPEQYTRIHARSGGRVFCFQVLLLGAGESGKSTFGKQLMLLTKGNLTDGEIALHRRGALARSLPQNIICSVYRLHTITTEYFEGFLTSGGTHPTNNQ